jgi:hypothetical protein
MFEATLAGRTAEHGDSSDSLEALIASLTGRAAVQGLTRLPNAIQRDIARFEGWIHLPTSFQL